MRAAEFKIVADLRNVVQHVLEIAGDGDLFNRVSQFAVFNPQAAGAAGEVAGHQVHAKAEKLGYVQATLYVGDDLLCVRVPGSR